MEGQCHYCNETKDNGILVEGKFCCSTCCNEGKC